MRTPMADDAPIDIDPRSPPFDRFGGLHRLASVRSGHASGQHARHQLYVARDRQSRANVLIKVTSKPGLVYEQNLTNEIDSLTTINRELPDSRYFPVLGEHGRLADGRVYLTSSLFDEWPLATTIGSERRPDRLVAHLRTTVEVAKALGELHGLEIWHVDLNPMNILSRWEAGKPVIRLVDFESWYEVGRHAKGAFLQSADDVRILRARAVASSARWAIGCVLVGRGALHDARRLSMDLGHGHQAGHRRRSRGRPGAQGRFSSPRSRPIRTGASRPSSSSALPWPRTWNASGRAGRGSRSRELLQSAGANHPASADRAALP